MCVGDWRLGRLIRVTAHSFVDPQAPVVLAKADKDRVGISFACADNPMDSVIGVRAGGVTNFMLLMRPDNNFFHFTMYEYGELTTLEWRIGANINSNTIQVFEYTLPDRVLRETIEQYKSSYLP